MSEHTAAVYRERLYQNDGLPELVQLVLAEERRVLDIGCGVGANMRLLRDRGHDVAGVTLSEREAEYCRGLGFQCEVADVTIGLPFDDGAFDAVVLSHVLEHTAWPDAVLGRVMRSVRSGGSVYIALPNALFFRQRFKFLVGQFRYTETGVMDRTHLRFFDFDSARLLLESVGVAVRAHFGVGFFPLRPLRRVAPAAARSLDRLAVSLWPSMFAFHAIACGSVPERSDV
jgi:SAM-dependent methyltransferase